MGYLFILLAVLPSAYFASVMTYLFSSAYVEQRQNGMSSFEHMFMLFGVAIFFVLAVAMPFGVTELILKAVSFELSLIQKYTFIAATLFGGLLLARRWSIKGGINR